MLTRLKSPSKDGRALALSLTALAVTIAGCGRPPVVQSDGPAPASRPPVVDGPGRPSTYWDNPNRGQPASTMAQAQKSLTFTARMPTDLGNPLRILINRKGADEDPGSMDSSISFVYDLTSYGRVVVAQHIDGSSLDQYLDEHRRLAAQSEQDGRANFEIVLIRGGEVEALLGIGPDGVATLDWREGSVAFLVTGKTLTRGDVIELAERV